MYVALLVIIIVSIAAGYLLGKSETKFDYYENSMSDNEYEFRFISLVSQIDSSKNITWIGQALDMLKADHRHYYENPRAMSTLDLLEEAVNEDNGMITNFIKSCGRMK